MEITMKSISYYCIYMSPRWVTHTIMVDMSKNLVVVTDKHGTHKMKYSEMDENVIDQTTYGRKWPVTKRTYLKHTEYVPTHLGA